MEEKVSFGLPKPKKGVLGLLVGIAAIWVFFAVSINWLGDKHPLLPGEEPGGVVGVFGKLLGSDDVFRGQVWRLFTNVFVHTPSGPGAAGHVLTVLAGLYFLGASLEERWGTKRFLMVTIGAGWFAALFQLLLGALIPRLHAEVFYGGLGMVDAIAVAWALGNRNQQARLFFILPVSGMALLAVILVMNVIYLIAGDAGPGGMVTPFAGMLAGYLFSDVSPLRRWYLKREYKKLQAQSSVLRGLGTTPKLTVIEGGASGKKPDRSMLH